MAVAYEAGPTGFGLARALRAAGISCEVAAPSKLIRPAGDRVKTDARDAAHLARLLHLGQITAVTIPTATQEAARDLVRAREDCRGDLMTARHRVSKLLLRQGIVYSGGQAWTGRHEVWLRSQRFKSAALQVSFDAAFDAMLACVDRRNRLDDAITSMAADSEFTPMVHRLGCIRGVATLTAFGLAVEIGDWHRLTGRSIGAYVGLVPSESSSGDSRTQGGVTKTGNGHVRACWSKPPGTTAASIGPELKCGVGGIWLRQRCVPEGKSSGCRCWWAGPDETGSASNCGRPPPSRSCCLRRWRW